MAISVVMCVHNGERFLAPAIDSVASQSFRDFEFIIVNDGSTDATAEILRAYRDRDPRIRIVDQPKRGLPASLNTAVAQAAHELIARMDADDMMMPNRLERQLWFIAQHPEISVACSYGELIDAEGRRIGRSEIAVDVDRGRKLLAPTYFLEIIHPSVLMRKQDLLKVGGYRELPFGEDRDLWGRMVTAGFGIACQPEVLIRYRLHSAAMSVNKQQRNMVTCDWIDANVVRRLQGQDEISYDHYLRERERRSPLEKIVDYRNRRLFLYYKQATRYYGDKKWLSFAGSLALAVALRPAETLRRVRRKLA